MERLVSTLIDAIKSRRSPVVIVETLAPVASFSAVVQAGAMLRLNPVYIDSMGRVFVPRKDEYGNLVWEQESDNNPLIAVQPLNRILKGFGEQSSELFIRSYVTEEHEVRELEALIKSLITLTSTYKSRSRLVILTSDLGLFKEPVARHCTTVQHAPPGEDELRKLFASLKLDVNSQVIDAARGLTEDQIFAAIAEKRRADPEHFYAMKKEVLTVAGLEVVEPTITLDAIGGYNYLKEYVRTVLIPSLREPDVLAKYGLARDRLRGILLYGLPGTGKTVFAMALAAEVGIPMVKLSPSQLFHGIVGESEKAVRRIVKVVEAMAPVVVFIDEADQLLTSRSAIQVGTDSGVTRRVTSALLEWLGARDRRSFVVAATNYAGDIDPAFLRPGRLDVVVPVLLPDAEARREIFRIHTRVLRNVPLVDVDEDHVVRSTELWTGAEIEKMVKTAAWYALKERAEGVNMEHVIRALEDNKVNLDLRKKRYQEFSKSLETIENVDRMVLKEALREMRGEVDTFDVTKGLIDMLGL